MWFCYLGGLRFIQVNEENVMRLQVVIIIKRMGYSEGKIKVVIYIIKSMLFRGMIVC